MTIDRALLTFQNVSDEKFSFSNLPLNNGKRKSFTVFPNSEDFMKIQYEFNKNAANKANGNFPVYIVSTFSAPHVLPVSIVLTFRSMFN